ncbi:hypothetical protein JHK85_057526 [Glycine max]|nr:hypothetical protein JHK85_057526 [Glycine max]
MKLQTHQLLLSFVLFSAVIISTISGTTITISPGTTLYASNTTQSWSSPNDTFSLHFLPLHPPTFPPSFTAAVVHSGGAPAVWSAGNGAAVDSAASFQFLPAGNLVLVNGSGSTVWDSGTSNMGVSSATLHDNGNLVLSNATSSVWSSFDNPTDTIVSFQNFTVGMVLRSGSFSFSVLSSGNLTLKWSDSVPYWDQGLNFSMSVMNLSSPVLGVEPKGVLQLFYPNLSAPVVVAYSSDYGEGSDVLRVLKLDGDGNLRVYSSKRGSGTVSSTWVAVEDQCEVFGYCGHNGVCSYNDSSSSPICGCPSQNFEMVNPSDSRKGCRRKVRLEDCVGKVAMLQLDHAQFLTYPPQFLINPEVFFIGISACSGNCLASNSCFASTSLSDGSGLCYIKTSNFISGYQNPALPSTSYIKGGLWLWCCRNRQRFGGFAAQYTLLERRKFSVWAYEEFEKGNIMGVIDRRLVNQEINLEQVKRVLMACFWCIQEQPSHRPTMSKVVQMLEGVIDIERPPAPKINSNAAPISTIATSSAPNYSSSSSLFTFEASPLALAIS